MGRWTDLASNRWIAKADVQDAINTSVLVVTGSAPGIGDEQFISKAQLEAWVNATGSGASTQFQVKSGITITPTYYSHWLSYDNGTNLAALCGGPTYEYFSNVATLAAGERIYSNSALTTYPPAGYYSDGTNVFYANNVGLLSYEGACGVSPF